MGKQKGGIMERNYSIDRMKFLCCIAVVCIHTSPFKDYAIGTIINVVSRVAVQLFFVSSGYLFYGNFNLNYTKKYIIKIAKLFISWTIFYIILGLSLASISNILNGNNVFYGYKDYFSQFNIIDLYYTKGIIKYHLWYLSSTIIIIPILYLIIKNNWINKFMIITLVINILGIFIYNSGLEIVETTRDAIFLGLFYSAMGVYININEKLLKNKFSKKISFKYMIVILSFIIISIVERGLYDIYFPKTADFYISTIPLTFLLFMLCIIRDSKKESFIANIGANSVGIYLIHIAFIDIIDIVLFKLNLTSITMTKYWQIIYTPIIIILSYISYREIQKIKFKIISTLTNYKVVSKLNIKSQ